MKATTELRRHLVGRTFGSIGVSSEAGIPIVSVGFGEGMAFIFRVSRSDPVFVALEWPGGQLPPIGGGDVSLDNSELCGVLEAIAAELGPRQLEAIEFAEGDAAVVLVFADAYRLTASGYDAFALGWPSTPDPSLN